MLRQWARLSYGKPQASGVENDETERRKPHDWCWSLSYKARRRVTKMLKLSEPGALRTA